MPENGTDFSEKQLLHPKKLDFFVKLFDKDMFIWNITIKPMVCEEVFRLNVVEKEIEKLQNNLQAIRKIAGYGGHQTINIMEISY